MFPNLEYGMALRGLLNYQLADKVQIEESRLSRCKRGRLAFTPAEMERIARVLSFDQAWLFSRPTPPRMQSAEPLSLHVEPSVVAR